MKYSPESQVTLNGDDMNSMVSTIEEHKKENNVLKETIEDYIQKDIENKSTLSRLEAELRGSRFECKKATALNKLLLKQYSTNKLDKLELESQKSKSIACARNYKSVLEENDSLKRELKQALELIAKTKEYRA